MVEAAERIGAERGIGAMSLREVQVASGQRNKSAAQYHFGSREGLIEAVVAARMGPINARRQELLAALAADAPVHEVVRALVEPLAEATMRPGSCWARFLLQGWADPALSHVVEHSFQASSYRTVRELLTAHLDALPEPLRRWRIDQAVGLVVTSLASAEAAQSGGRRAAALPAAAQVSDLVDVCTALLTAPASLTTTAQLDRPRARRA